MEKLYNLEDNLLAESGIPIEQFQKEKLFYNEQSDYLHLICIGDPQKPWLILVAGYGATSAFSYNMFPILIKTYYILALDLAGFGLSSRPDFNCKTKNESIDFFVVPLKYVIENQFKSQ